MMQRKNWLAWFGAFLLLLAPMAWAEDDEESSSAGEAVMYIQLSPSFVANYGQSPRLRFLKAEVSLRVRGQDRIDMVNHHMPLIRHTLVMVFSGVGDNDLRTTAQREAVRQQALKAVQTALLAEENDAVAEDLLFTSFVVQR